MHLLFDSDRCVSGNWLDYRPLGWSSLTILVLSSRVNLKRFQIANLLNFRYFFVSHVFDCVDILLWHILNELISITEKMCGFYFCTDLQ